MHTAATSATTAHSDEELMRLVQAADDHAFGLLYDRYADGAWQLASLLCRSGDRAERIVRDAFVVAWQRRATYRPDRETVRAWAMRLVYRRAAHPASLDPPGEARPRQRDVGKHRDLSGAEAEELPGALHRLAQAQREIIALAFYGGLTHAQIAGMLELSPGTVKGRMRLGLHELRGAVDQDDAHRQ